MPEITRKELQLQLSDGQILSLDIHYNSKQKSATPILFCHGFKGFKDWGCNNLIANEFAKTNYFFIKFNFSRNGVILDNLSDITDAEAFGQNNFSRELEDLKLLLDSLENGSDAFDDFTEFYDFTKLVLIGHSRGGSMALISAIEDSRIKKVLCWAPVIDLSKYAEMKDPLDWQQEPVMIKNGRTGEEYPIYYQFYEDYLANSARLNLQSNLAQLDKPLLIIHGGSDEAVPISHSQELYDLVPQSLLIQVDDSGHTFGAKHPWEKDILPSDLADVIEECVEFLEM
jgi:pimeloyl-ACP methyl ester carboxylesterase